MGEVETDHLVTDKNGQTRKVFSKPIFKEYTKSGCIFECLIRVAHEYCDCVPWNIPSVSIIEEC